MINEADEPPDVDGYKLIGGRALQKNIGEPLCMTRAVLEVLTEDFRGRRSISDSGNRLPALRDSPRPNARRWDRRHRILSSLPTVGVALIGRVKISSRGERRGGRLEKRRLRFYALYKDSYARAPDARPPA